MRARAGILLTLALALSPRAAAAADDPPLHTVVRDDDGALEPAGVLDVMRPALRVFRDRDGLPQNSAMAIAFGEDGTLWVGTQDGVASFDGRGWTTAALPHPEVSSFVRDVIVDHAGAVWVARQDGGLARLAGGTWTTYGAAEGLPSGRVDSLVEARAADGSRTLWAGTRAGLARFDGTGWHAFAGTAALPSPRITRLLAGIDDDGAPVLWVGTEAGLAQVRGDVVASVPGAPRTLVHALLETADADGSRTLWVGASREPLYRRTRGTWKPTGAPAIPHADVWALGDTLAADGTHVVWVGTDDGVTRLDHGRWIAMPDDVLPSRFAWTFGAEPRPGPTSDLWIGCDTGLVRVHLGGWSSIDRAMGMPQESVYALLVTEDLGDGEALWLGTRGGGLTRYQGGRWHVFGAAEGFDAKTVFALGEHVEPDGARSLYVGTQDEGLLRWDGARMRTIDPSGTVRRITESTGADGRPEMWVTNADSGLLHHAGDRWEHVGHAQGAPFDSAFAAVETPGPEGERSLLVATQGSGVARRHGGKWTTFDRASGAVLADSVTSIAVTARPDGHHELWAGTEGGGASRLDLDSPGAQWHVLTPTTPTAIPNGTVYEITSDARRRVYLATNKGVARISWLRPGSDEDADLLVETFNAEDGLPANEMNGGALATDARGRIWAGTIAGAAVFDPAREVEPPEATLRLAGRSLAGAGRPIAGGEALAFDESGVAFDATLVSLFRGEETAYRTQIVGLDPAPGPWRADGHRELSSLGSGSYAVRAWARDFRGRVQGPLELSFRVRPAPWFTWWAFALYAAVAALAVRATVRWRVQAVERRNVELEAKIRERTSELARANRAKTTFLSTMSHELRTPLNAILGFSQLLSRDRSLPSEARESVDVVVKSGEHLLGLINDVLSITKIESGKMALDETAFSLEGAVDAVEKMIRVRARSKRLTLQVECRPGMPPAVLGDEGKVRQILLNLLGNAVKFTNEGGVAMRAWWERGTAHFEVQDTGTGIAARELGTLFEPFVQTDAGRKAKEGTGLGLFISRSYARLMEGDITVESEPGRGTTFRVTLALPAAEASPSRADPRRVVGMAQGQGPFRILVVDDSPDNRAVLARLLDKVGGFDVRQAATGTEAIAVFAEHRPHLTWMDLRMDGVDGIGATQAIRDMEIQRGWPRSAIVALSASAFDRDREWLLASGCDDFVAKPYRENAIFDAIGRHLGVRFVHEGETTARAATAVTSERLGSLPEKLRAGLEAAARAGDLRAARDVVGEIGRLDEELGRSLREMVEGFRLEEIESLLAEHV